MELVKNTIEKYAFGVCQYLGEKLNISAGRVRTYFIYLSFVTFGSPVLIYLFLAFWINIKKYIKKTSFLGD